MPASEFFDGWARQLRRAGLRELRGDVVADPSFFTERRLHPDWPPRHVWKPYSAPVSALAVNENCVKIVCTPAGDVGQPAAVRMEPELPFLTLRNSCTTSAEKHLIWFYRAARSSRVSVGGKILASSEGYTDRLTVPEPARYGAVLLKNALESAGITVSGGVRVERGAGHGMETLLRRRTPLLPLLRVMLQESQNLYAEHTIRTVGAEAAGEGSWEAGLARAGALLESLGFSDNNFELADGSGLSRDNRLSAELLTALLAHMHGHPVGVRFSELLPGPGEGTLRSRLSEEPYRSSVRAKTGHLYGVGALSGYVTGTKREVAFSLLINDSRPQGRWSMKKLEDAICRAIVEAVH
jgi:D-alanyl-D-alanine carboxypeptidase/D-alanyl-D-alanine-endopeptidase (penicillin-binding protein 4)